MRHHDHRNRKSDIRKATLITVLGLLVGWGSVTTARAADAAEIKQLGEYVATQTTPEAEVVLGYRYASMSAGRDWLILELALTSPPGKTAEVQRDRVFLRTPDGTRVPLASQGELGKAYGKIQNQIAQANVAREPLDYFPPNRERCSVQFFEDPGEGLVYDQVTVDSYRACQGKLFFKIPGGVQPGRYVLGIDLEESAVRIPFEVPAA